MVAPEHREAIEAHRDEVLALLSLDDSTRAFAFAVYYATWKIPEEVTNSGRSPWGEVWLLLESVVQMQDTPAVHLMTVLTIR